MAKQPRLRYGMPERWAVEWGEDQHGMFMGFGVGEVVQRLRYIPPGRFLMGSPEGELGRWQDEGPQHEAVVTGALQALELVPVETHGSGTSCRAAAAFTRSTLYTASPVQIAARLSMRRVSSGS